MRTLRRVLFSLLLLSVVTEMPTPEGFTPSLLPTPPTAGIL